MTDTPPPSDRFARRVPEGDDRERLICEDCGFVQYENPKIVVGAVAHHGPRILLCRRAIPPRVGYWTLPAGYLELGEDPETGARREAWEEARADLDLEQLLAVYAIHRISQVQLIYRARLRDPAVAAGPESREVALFTWDEIPWDEIAFPTVHWALADFDATRHETAFPPRRNPEGAQGTMPSGV